MVNFVEGQMMRLAAEQLHVAAVARYRARE
jgi:hypothetical protein